MLRSRPTRVSERIALQSACHFSIEVWPLGRWWDTDVKRERAGSRSPPVRVRAVVAQQHQGELSHEVHIVATHALIHVPPMLASAAFACTVPASADTTEVSYESTSMSSIRSFCTMTPGEVEFARTGHGSARFGRCG
jgi:hypothetical protein